MVKLVITVLLVFGSVLFVAGPIQALVVGRDTLPGNEVQAQLDRESGFMGTADLSRRMGTIDSPEELVFVTEDRAATHLDGCDAISVLNSNSGLIAFQGKGRLSPGRLAVSIGASTLTAIASHSNGEAAFLSIVHRDADGQWSSGHIDHTKTATFGGLFVDQTDKTFMIAEANHGPSPLLVNQPRFNLTGYSLPDRVSPITRIGSAVLKMETRQPVVEILPAGVPNVFHLILADSELRTIDVRSMTEVAEPVRFGTVDSRGPAFHQYSVDRIHADITRDGRFVMVGRAYSASIAVIDTIDRVAHTGALGSEVRYAGGIAINKGWANTDLVAVHQWDSVAVYRFVPPSSLQFRDRIGIAPLGEDFDIASAGLGPKAAIAWSGSGDRVIAAIDSTSGEFSIIDVADTGDLTQRYIVEACPDGRNYPNDIVTFNGMITPTATATSFSTDTATAQPTPSSTGTLVPTDTPSAVPPTLTHTSTLTSSATPAPESLYLPMALREDCRPSESLVDIVVVLDASSSMGAGTSAGRTKLAAAVSAAGQLLEGLNLSGGDRAGLVVFNQSVVTDVMLTGDRLTLVAALEAVVVEPGTCIPCGVEAGVRQLMDVGRDGARTRTLLLLTDGQSNVRPVEDAIELTVTARREGIVIFAVGLGEDVEEAALRQMVSHPAFYYRTLDAEALAGVFSAIVMEIPCPAASFWGMR